MQQINFGGYQPTQPEVEEQQNELLNAIGVAGLGLGGAALGGFGIDTERRVRDARFRNEDLGYRQAATESVDDLRNALRVLTNNTPFDVNRRTLENPDSDVSPPLNRNTTRLRSFLQSNDSDPAAKGYSLKVDPNSRTRNSLTQAAVAARDAFIPSAEDLLSGRREANEAQGRSAEGPRTDTAISRMPLVDLAREYLPERLGGFSPEVKEFRRTDSKLQTLGANPAQKIGSMLGRTGSDFVNNGTRSFWWLVNAPQAVSDLVSESSTAVANRHGLYGQDLLLYDEAKKRGWIPEGSDPFEVEPEQGVREVYRRNIDKAPRVEAAFNRLVDSQEGLNRLSTAEIRALGPEARNRYRMFAKRRVNNNLSTLLALPAAVGINAGIGLTNPLGGDDGREAAVPSQDDKTKTDNVLLEIASKYILGRQGDVLPWDEFKKVRPDVTKDEYMRYKAYKWDKKADYNPLDGDLNLFGGIFKAELDDETAIFGPEVQFLGKSLPLYTTIVPTLGAVAGAAAGAAVGRYGQLNTDGIAELQLDVDAERRAAEKQLEVELAKPKPDKRRENRLTSKINGLHEKSKKLQDRKDFLTNDRFGHFFRNRRHPVATGLVGGMAGLLGTGLIGAELERRRREKKTQENAEYGLSNPQLPS